jgi:hypothetical protein
MRRRLFLQSISTLVLTFSVLIVTPGHAIAQSETALAQSTPMIRRPLARRAAPSALDFARTELFFGTAKPDGSVVTDAQFVRFLDGVVTPRFPDGLTVLEADGQFRLENGDIIKEKSFVLILLYPVEDFRESSRKINRIRELYKERFQQESVLRVDDPLAVRVSF